jgi:AraC-like DNA-binding protein
LRDARGVKKNYDRTINLVVGVNMKLYIKYMVSLRCKMIVQEALEKLNIKYVDIELGLVETLVSTTKEKRYELADILKKSGLQLLNDKKSILIEKIKVVIIQMVHYSDELPNQNYSEYLSEKLGYDYTYLANTFSEVKGITIQHFIIIHKIERAKELMLYNEMNLTEIAYKLHYSSVAHLSNQFKKVTGLSPSFYRQLGKKRKQNLEDI